MVPSARGQAQQGLSWPAAPPKSLRWPHPFSPTYLANITMSFVCSDVERLGSRATGGGEALPPAPGHLEVHPGGLLREHRVPTGRGVGLSSHS